MKRKTKKNLKQENKVLRQFIKTLRRMIATNFELEQLEAEFRPTVAAAQPATESAS